MYGCVNCDVSRYVRRLGVRLMCALRAHINKSIFGNYCKKHVEEWLKIVFVNVNSLLLADDRRVDFGSRLRSLR